MAEILGKFTSGEFTVLKPKQQSQQQPKEGQDKSPENPQPTGDKSDEEKIDEIPLKTKEEILEDLKNAGVDEEDRNEEKSEPAPYDIGDESGENEENKDKEGKGESEDKGEEEKPIKEKTQSQKKIDEKNAKLKEERDLIKAKNIVTEKINHYNKVLIKHGDKLPNKVKNTLNNAISELENLRSSIKT